MWGSDEERGVRGERVDTAFGSVSRERWNVGEVRGEGSVPLGIRL